LRRINKFKDNSFENYPVMILKKWKFMKKTHETYRISSKKPVFSSLIRYGK
jgi:hypothetical protein